MTVARSRTNNVFVPGRVNLIGEHTDYNGGLALPFAVNLGVTASRTTHPGGGVTIDSDGFGSWRDDDATDAEWSRRAASVVALLGATSTTVHLRSSLPEGAGLSSSAAFLGALALALDAPGSLIDVATMVRDCEAAPHHSVGLLDPLATLGARDGHALLIDFHTLHYEDVAVPTTLNFTVVYSGEPRSLASSAYAQRRSECDQAAQYFGGWDQSSVDSWKDVPDGVVRRRARHVLSENQRVRELVTALRASDAQTVGSIVSASHRSLRDDFDVSTTGIDALVTHLEQQSGVHGARIIGGGFGGCVLVVHDAHQSVDVGGHTSWRVRPSPGAFELLGRAR